MIKMNNENNYYYCVVHKKSLLLEDVDSHRDNTCEFILEEFQWKHRSQRKLSPLPRNVIDAMGMKIYIPKKRTTYMINTLPKSAKIYEPERRQLG